MTMTRTLKDIRSDIVAGRAARSSLLEEKERITKELRRLKDANLWEASEERKKLKTS